MSNTIVPITGLADKVEITINSRSGFVGLGKINPEERLNIAGNFQLNYHDTGAGDVYIQAAEKDSAGNNAKINLNIITNEQTAGASGDIVIAPGDGINFNSTGHIELKQKAQILDNTGVILIQPGFVMGPTAAEQYITTSTPDGDSPSVFTHVAVDYDRYITLLMGTSGSGSARVAMFCEESQGSNVYYLPYRQVQDAFTSASMLVPAGCRFRILVTPIGAFSSNIAIKARKFGRS